VLILLLSVLLVLRNIQYAGASGARRFDALSDDRARTQHEVHRTGTEWWVAWLAATAAVDCAAGIWLGSVRTVVTAAAVLVLVGVATALGRSARANVSAGFSRRGLEALHQHETSSRRTRRMRQFLGTALVGYVVFRATSIAVDETGRAWLDVVGVIAAVVVLIGVIGAIWAMAWRFGDEQPESR
jgi:hypothetical protein